MVAEVESGVEFETMVAPSFGAIDSMRRARRAEPIQEQEAAAGGRHFQHLTT